jgi:hypothetical protein
VGRRTPLLLGILLVTGLGAPEPARAQGQVRPVIILDRRDLVFGNVFVGVPRVISRLDPTNSAFYRVQGQPGAEISFTFALPAHLTSAAGVDMTIEFAAGDAAFAPDANQAGSVPFDPQVPFTARLSADGRAYVWLGGTVRPGPNQPAAFYEAGVVLTVAYTGN